MNKFIFNKFTNFNLFNLFNGVFNSFCSFFTINRIKFILILFLGSYSLILLGFGYAVVNSFFSDINTIDATVQNNIFQDITALNNNHGFINYKNIMPHPNVIKNTYSHLGIIDYNDFIYKLL